VILTILVLMLCAIISIGIGLVFYEIFAGANGYDNMDQRTSNMACICTTFVIIVVMGVLCGLARSIGVVNL
jgi:hypothetical protein